MRLRRARTTLGALHCGRAVVAAAWTLAVPPTRMLLHARTTPARSLAQVDETACIPVTSCQLNGLVVWQLN